MVTPILQSDLDFSGLVGNSLEKNYTSASSQRIKNSFAINNNTGQISISNNSDLDFEGTPKSNLSITIADTARIADWSAIALNLTDIFESKITLVSDDNLGLVLWNKLGSQTEIEDSEIGADFQTRNGVINVDGLYGGALATEGGGNGGGGYLSISPDDRFCFYFCVNYPN